MPSQSALSSITASSRGKVNPPTFPLFIGFIHRIHKWRTRGKKLVPSHESEALEDKQKLQMKTFSELAECLARIPPKITLYGRLFKYNYVGCLPAFNV